MKKIIGVLLALLLLVGLMPVSAVTFDADRFVPTAQEREAAQQMTQSGIISYDAVADTDMSANLLMTAAIIVAAIAGAVLIFTVIVLVNHKSRIRHREMLDKL